MALPVLRDEAQRRAEDRPEGRRRVQALRRDDHPNRESTMSTDKGETDALAEFVRRGSGAQRAVDDILAREQEKAGLTPEPTPEQLEGLRLIEAAGAQQPRLQGVDWAASGKGDATFLTLGAGYALERVPGTENAWRTVPTPLTPAHLWLVAAGDMPRRYTRHERAEGGIGIGGGWEDDEIPEPIAEGLEDGLYVFDGEILHLTAEQLEHAKAIDGWDGATKEQEASPLYLPGLSEWAHDLPVGAEWWKGQMRKATALEAAAFFGLE
jgi:hypothetical protein